MTTAERAMQRIAEISNKLPQKELDEALGISKVDKNGQSKNRWQNYRHTK